jgi:thiosulfate dehydrogenase (quinone) large subunit
LSDCRISAHSPTVWSSNLQRHHCQQLSVRPYALSLVFVEAILGLLLLMGLGTRWSLLLGAAMIASLVFGTALRSDWNNLAIQMLYAFIYAALIAGREYNSYSVDARIQQ